MVLGEAAFRIWHSGIIIIFWTINAAAIKLRIRVEVRNFYMHIYLRTFS